MKEQIRLLIQDTMLAKGMNQSQLASYLGITRQTLHNWLRGTHLPNWATTNRIMEHDRGFALNLRVILLTY